MPEYHINVGQIEELQMINDRDELERILARAKSMVVQGGVVVLSRMFGNKAEPFDEISTEDDLENYRGSVMKFVK